MTVRVHKPGQPDLGPVLVPERESALQTEAQVERPEHGHGNHHRVGVRVSLHREHHLTPHKALRRPLHFQNGPLEEWSREVSANHNEWQTIQKGTFSKFGGKSLDVVSFQTLVLDYDPEWVVNPIAHDPIQVAKHLRQICDNGWVFRLTVGQRMLWNKLDVNMLATLRSITITERAGEPDARYFDLSFSEFREAEIKRKHKGKRLPTTIRVHKDGRAEGMHSDTTNKPATIVRIAREFYKSTKYADFIVRHNRRLWNWPHHRSLGDFVVKKNNGRPFKIRLPRKPGHGHDGGGNNGHHG